MLRDRKERELTKLFGEVEVDTIVNVMLPEGCDTIGSFKDQARDVKLEKASCNSKARRASTHNDGSSGEEVDRVTETLLLPHFRSFGRHVGKKKMS